jgi:hypothetical protein
MSTCNMVSKLQLCHYDTAHKPTFWVNAFKLTAYAFLFAEILTVNLLQIVPPAPVEGAHAVCVDIDKCICTLCMNQQAHRSANHKQN